MEEGLCDDKLISIKVDQVNILTLIKLSHVSTTTVHYQTEKPTLQRKQFTGMKNSWRYRGISTIRNKEKIKSK
jgi:hypothetical protein